MKSSMLVQISNTPRTFKVAMLLSLLYGGVWQIWDKFGPTYMYVHAAFGPYLKVRHVDAVGSDPSFACAGSARNFIATYNNVSDIHSSA